MLKIWAEKYPFLLGFILAGVLFGWVLLIDQPGVLVMHKKVKGFQMRTSPLQRHNYETAARLKRDVKIMCLILTQAHESHVRAVKETWGRQCTQLIFMTTEMPIFTLRTKAGDEWAKFKELFQETNDLCLNQYHWFYVLNADTYTIMENMRYFLARYSHAIPIYFGKKLKNHVQQGWMAPKAGVVFSQAAIRRFVEQSPKYCQSAATGLSASIKLGDCMETLGIIAGDARDANGLELFHHVNPMAALFSNDEVGRRDNNFYEQKMSGQLVKLSSRAIAFHQIGVHEMYELEFLLNQLEVYGTFRLPASVPRHVNFGHLMTSFVETAD